jgi:hypothetical protein
MSGRVDGWAGGRAQGDFGGWMGGRHGGAVVGEGRRGAAQDSRGGEMGRHGLAGGGSAGADGRSHARWPQRPLLALSHALCLLCDALCLATYYPLVARSMPAMSAMSSDSRDVIGLMSPRSRSPPRDRRAPRPPRAPGGEARAAGCQNRGHKNRAAIKPARRAESDGLCR